MGSNISTVRDEQKTILLVQGFNRYLTRLQMIRPSTSHVNEINKICFHFYFEKEDYFDKIGDNIKINAAKQIVKCASVSRAGIVNTCYGHEIIESLHNNKIYVWKFKICAKSSYWGDDGDGICIGIAEQNLNALNDDLSTYSTITQYYYCSNGDTETYSKWDKSKPKWSTKESGPRKITTPTIAPKYGANDVITMRLNMKKRKLRFWKNGKDARICYKNIMQGHNIRYKFAVYLFGDYTSVSSVQLLASSVSGCIDDVHVVDNNSQEKNNSQKNDELGICKHVEIEEYIISKALVLIICISSYNNAYDNLEGCKIDKQNMIKLWKEHYDYDVIFNKNDKVGYADFMHLLNECRSVLGKKKNKNKYSGLIIIFSCHGDSQNLICSDGKKVSRTQIIQWFNGDNVPFMIYKPKIIVMDACRGGPYNFPNVIPKNKIFKGTNDDEYHPDEQFILLYSTTDGYAVADDDKKGGNVIRTLYDIFSNDDNINKYHLDDLFKATQKKVKKLCAAYQCIEQ
eukprot:177215_1